MTVMTGKLSITYMEVLIDMVLDVVSFMMRIWWHCMMRPVLQTTVIYDELYPYTICSRMLSNPYRKFIIIIMQDTGTLIKIIGLFIAVVGLGNLT